MPIIQPNMDGIILQRVQWQLAYTVTQFRDPGCISFPCDLLCFSVIMALCICYMTVCVLGREKTLHSSYEIVQRTPLLTFAATAAAHHFQFSHFCNRKKMLKSNNQEKSQPAPWSCCAEWQWRSYRKKKKKKTEGEKRGGNFLLKLDLIQLARRGGFLNACETWLLS